MSADWIDSGVHRLWRQHHDAVVGAWLNKWLKASPPSRLLKTDLFEEATGTGVIELGSKPEFEFVGVDISSSIVEAAGRHPHIHTMQADVRELPFEQRSFDCIVSTSTLDHFATFGELRSSLVGLLRLLKPSGQLLLTLDNLSNPVVRLRNALPNASLTRLGLVPYQIGASCSRRSLRQLLDEQGATISELTALLHCPRLLMVQTARWLDRLSKTGRSHGAFLTFLNGWEQLRRWPSKFQTGYYLAARVVPASPPPTNRRSRSLI